MIRRLNLPVADEAVLNQLALSRRPLGMSATRPTYHLVRDTYFDTADGALRGRRMTLRVRSEARGRHVVELTVLEAVNLNGIVEEVSFEAPIVDGGLYATLAGSSEVATRVREVVDPDALRPQLALDIDRESRELKKGPFGRAGHHIVFDQMVGHAPGITRAFQEVTLTELTPGRTDLETLAALLRTRHDIHSDGLGTYERVRQALPPVALATLEPMMNRS